MEFIDRVSAYPNRYVMTDENGNTSYVYLERADEPTVPGTPLNAETFDAMADAILEKALPLSGGTMTGSVDMGKNNLTGINNADAKKGHIGDFKCLSANGVKMEGFYLDTRNNQTYQIPTYTSKWGMLVSVTSPVGFSTLCYITGQNNTITTDHRIYNDARHIVSVSNGVWDTDAGVGYINVSCDKNWAVGWYINTFYSDFLEPRS